MDGAQVSIVDEAEKRIKVLKKEIVAPLGFTLLLRGEGAKPAQQWKRVRLSPTLSAKLTSQVTAAIKRLLDRDTAEYTYDDMTPSVLGVWRSEELPDFSPWLQEIPDHTWTHVFDGASGFDETIKYQVFLIQINGGTVRAFLKKGTHALAHKGIAAHFVTSKNEFSEVSGKVFAFEAGVDFFEFQGSLFVGNSSAFELVTHVRKITSERVEQVINSFHERAKGDVVFVRRKELYEAIRQKPLFAKKIASARVMGTIAALTAQKMIKRIRAKHLSILHEVHDGKYYFKVDEGDPKSVRDFVELITDTYLISEVTDFEYKTHAKERVRS
jgi:hypothetical protein